MTIQISTIQINLSDIIAALALLLSLILVFIEVGRRLSKLHFNVTGLTLIDVVDNTIGLLMHVTVVNSSILPRTVYKMYFKPINGYQILQVDGVQDFERALVVFSPFDKNGKAVMIRLEDVADFPLDIEPHHSKTISFAMTVSPIHRPLSAERGEKASLTMFGYLVGFDYKNKQIAKLRVELPL